MTENPNNELSRNIISNSKKNPLKFVQGNRKNNTLDKKPFSHDYQLHAKIYRQGDILFKKIDNLPTQLKEKSDNIVAEGEETGHSHQLVNGALFELINSDSLYIKSEKNTKIIHQEHLPIKLEPGNYEVIRQREYLGSGSHRQITRQVRD
ncbi:MAG: hypothetical protein ACFE9Z_02690 [Promethearchaeota archaeon]